jgi:hypothetical protein
MIEGVILEIRKDCAVIEQNYQEFGIDKKPTP